MKIAALKSKLEEQEKHVISLELKLLELKTLLQEKEDIIRVYTEENNQIKEILKSKEETITLLKDILYKKFEIDPIDKNWNKIDPKKIGEKEIGEIINCADLQKKQIGEFKASVIYPLYKLTHSFGKTKLGKRIQKIIK
jgi:hypothetical protein